MFRHILHIILALYHVNSSSKVDTTTLSCEAIIKIDKKIHHVFTLFNILKNPFLEQIFHPDNCESLITDKLGEKLSFQIHHKRGTTYRNFDNYTCEVHCLKLHVQMISDK